jgi:hypothetical protein
VLDDDADAATIVKRTARASKARWALLKRAVDRATARDLVHCSFADGLLVDSGACWESGSEVWTLTDEALRAATLATAEYLVALRLVST